MSLNELATIINTLVEQAVAEKEAEPILTVLEESYQDPLSGQFFNGMEDGTVSLPLHKMDSVRPDDVIVKRSRPFQYYGSRGKKALDYGSGKRLFNYMPSRG